MNIRDVISAIKLNKPTVKMGDNTEQLLEAISTSNLSQIASHIRKNPHSNLRHQRVANAFFENFTPELGALFLKELSFSIVEKSMDIGINIPSSFWMWLAQQKRSEVSAEVFHWSISALVSTDTSEFEQNHAHQFRHAYIQHNPESKTQIADIAFPRLNEPCVFQWRTDDWAVLKSITHKKFSTHFFNNCSPEVMMTIDDPHGLLALQTSFDNLPIFESAFNAFFKSNTTDYNNVCLQFTSPEGFQKSPGFLSLDKKIQKEILEDIKIDFEGSDEEDEECEVSVGHYKQILNYTPQELFLKRFNESNERLMKKVHIGGEKTMQKLFDRKCSLSSLHALVAQSPHILLKMNKNMEADIAQCFDDGMVLMGFFNNISGKTFGKILHRFPNLVNWRDEKGNSLGHWCAVFNAIENDWFNALVQHPRLLEYNNIGHTIRDIMQKDIDRDLLSNTDEVAQLEKIILMREIGGIQVQAPSKRKI